MLFFSVQPAKVRALLGEPGSKDTETGSPKCNHSTYLDVPNEWLGERFLTDAEHLKKVNEIAYRHEYLSEEVGTGLEVFTNIELRTISDEEIATFDRIRQGLDFGYTVDPLAFERMHYDRTRRRLYIFTEISGLNLFNRQFWEKAQRYNDVMTIADSAGAEKYC